MSSTRHSLSEAIVLAGGAGTRLRSVVADRPKPLAAVGSRPFLEWILLRLRASGIKRIVLATGFMSQRLSEYFGDGSQLNLTIVHAREPVPLGTAGAIRYALAETSSDPVLVLNGDSYCRFDLLRLFSTHIRRRAAVTIWTVRATHVAHFGSVEVGPDGNVLAFTEKAESAGDGVINAGIYLFRRDVLEALPVATPLSVERDILPSLVGCGLEAVLGDGPFVDIGTPESYAQAASILEEELSQIEGVSG